MPKFNFFSIFKNNIILLVIYIFQNRAMWKYFLYNSYIKQYDNMFFIVNVIQYINKLHIYNFSVVFLKCLEWGDSMKVI
jgi:hypothetical protein